MNILLHELFTIRNVIRLESMFIESRAASAGWTAYQLISYLPQAISTLGSTINLWFLSIVIFIESKLLGGINYIVTILN